MANLPFDKDGRLVALLRRLDEHAAHCRKVQAENEDKGLNNTADIFRVMANCHEQDADLLRSVLSAPSHVAEPAPCHNCTDPQACSINKHCAFAPSSTERPSREEAYRKAFVLTLGAALAGGWFAADPMMKERVLAYLHSANLTDEQGLTVEKVLHDAMGVPTDTDRAFVPSIPASATERSTKDGERWRALKELAGYYQDGSQTTVKLYQDDATRSCFIEVGGKTYGTGGVYT